MMFNDVFERMTRRRAPVTLIGRGRESGALDARLGALREHGFALVVHGEAGVGKSALLAAASDRAERAGMRVLRVSGVRSETGAALAGLHQMLRPLLERAQGLPRPQRDALLATFGINEALAPDTFRIAVAALELLAVEAEKAPLLVVVDDAQWLDPPTVDVLCFVARRLGPEPVALLVAVRDGYETALVECGLPELWVEALDEESSGALLDARAPRLGSGLRGRLLAAAAGNPLALVELPAVVGSRPPVGFGLPDRLPMPARLEQALLGRFCDLPAATQAILLVASVDEHACLSEVLTAARLLGETVPVGLDDLSPAVAAGLVEHDHRSIRFGHPLRPAAIYQAATSAHRHRAHAALATVLVDRPDRRAWHRAASTTGPDETVATELERASLAAATRGAAGVTLAAVERAAELTPDTSRRRQRLLRAAELAADLGRLDRASWLLGEIDPVGSEPLERARVGLVRDMIEPRLLADPKAVDSLVDAAMQASAAGEVDLALRLLHAAAMRSWWADPGPEARRRVIAAAQRVPATDGDPRLLSILGISDPAGHGAMVSEVASYTAPDTCDPQAAYAIGTALHVTGAFALSTTFLTAAIAGFRDHGSLWLLPQALAQDAWNAVYAGNWSVATAAADEAASLARDTHQPLWEAAARAARAMITAVRGDVGSAEAFLGEAEAIALPVGASAVLSDVQLTRGVMALAAGRYDEAFQHLRRTFDPRDPAHHHVRSSWRIGEYAEAAVHAGHIDEARQQLARCEGLARLSPSPRLQIGLLYARFLLADEDTAEAHFEAALAEDMTPWPLYRARLLLEYGAWLRRRRRIAQARMPLRAAREAFDALGAVPWAERAQQELRASRETRNHQPQTWTQLTEQEQQIAHLAAQGLSNRQIAQRLYISHRTVGSHLYRIFPKLGIASRAQLPCVIGSFRPATAMS